MGSRGLRASAHQSQDGGDVWGNQTNPISCHTVSIPKLCDRGRREPGCWDDQGALPGEDTPGFLSEENEKHEDRPGGSTGRTALGGCPCLYLYMSACVDMCVTCMTQTSDP